MGEMGLHAPEPTQDVDSENGNPGSGSDAGESLLRARFAMREAIAANHNRNQACDLGDGSSEEGLQSGEAGVERRAADCA